MVHTAYAPFNICMSCACTMPRLLQPHAPPPPPLTCAVAMLLLLCSVGTAEDYRPDHQQFEPADMGLPLPAWPQER